MLIHDCYERMRLMRFLLLEYITKFTHELKQKKHSSMNEMNQRLRCIPFSNQNRLEKLNLIRELIDVKFQNFNENLI